MFTAGVLQLDVEFASPAGRTKSRLSNLDSEDILHLADRTLFLCEIDGPDKAARSYRSEKRNRASHA